MIIYKSEAHQKYKWMNEHPIKSAECYLGIELKWYQKLIFLCHWYRSRNYKEYKNKRKFNKLMKKLIR